MTSGRRTLAAQPKRWYPGLDGVRAVAVLLVFTVHYMGSATYYVGWTGVMIFFVLSGFLITGILFDNRNETHRFRNFYMRRTLRIFPLFYFVWLCILVAGFFCQIYWHPLLFLWPAYLGNYARFLAGTTTVDHILTNYPQRPIEIGHFWSLAVEEQFYLLWPLVVFKVASRIKLIRICAAVMIFTLLLRIVLVAMLPQRVLEMEFLYRMTFTQADGFLSGGLLALWMRGPEEGRLLRWAPALLWGSLGILCVSVLLHGGVSAERVALQTTAPWVSTYGFTLLDFAAAGLLLSSLRAGTFLYRFMTLLPVRILGRYSYGFYVYHLLLAPFLPLVLPAFHVPSLKWWPSFPNYVRFAEDFLIVLAVSAVSYELFEKHFLKLKRLFVTRHDNPDAQAVWADAPV
jgi:peptidoglycan/LPS O-acetylase OafA/YrhL